MDVAGGVGGEEGRPGRPGSVRLPVPFPGLPGRVPTVTCRVACRISLHGQFGHALPWVMLGCWVRVSGFRAAVGGCQACGPVPGSPAGVRRFTAVTATMPVVVPSLCGGSEGIGDAAGRWESCPYADGGELAVCRSGVRSLPECVSEGCCSLSVSTRERDEA